ncbi:MAG TPA: tetratricopeptide repeat protein [Candidatus Nanopelagicales bacterium]|nr:tetratricopeptide repeat protein [Candidatus Nanopelagicales bacterium]
MLGRGASVTRARTLENGVDLLLHVPSSVHIVPGHVATVVLTGGSRRRGRVYGAELRALRVDVAALGLPQMQVHDHGLYAASVSPSEGQRTQAPRIAYAMKQVLPWHAEEEDPILESIARRERGDLRSAGALLVDMLRRDLRCIDAHAHLGNLAFLRCAEHARAHYEVGIAIGDHALGPDFRGVLPWSYVGNRPFLRCLHGLGLSLWRRERLNEAAQVFERLLSLNPTDQQRAGQCLKDVRAGRVWED